MKLNKIIVLTLVLLVAGCPNLWAEDNIIRIGCILPSTGWFELPGVHAKNAAELVRKDVEAAGGIQVGDKKYQVEFVYGNNESNPTVASAVTVKQISVEKVLAIVGGLSSSQAIPMGQMAQAFATPMISPWSTSLLTTKDRPYVFRSCIVSTVMGPAAAKFAASEFKATKAAVLYDIVAAYPRDMAKSFKEAFEAQNGPGSVIAFEEFRSGEKDFSKQLARIRDSGAQVIFTPQHYNEVPLIVCQAKKMGLTIPIMENSWGGGDLIRERGNDCNGLFFTGNYASGNATGLNKQFVDAYVKAYGQNPDEPAALTWDAFRVMLEAIKKTGGLSAEILIQDRTLVKDSLSKIKDFDGATGKLTYNGSGDPSKCVIIVKIDDKGVFTSHDSICP